jgi:hypothetical protein
MNRMSIGLATLFVAAVTAGCGTVTASQPNAGGPPAVSHTGQTPATATHAAASASPAATAALPRCNGAVPTGPLLVITTAGNGKTFCIRVGEQVDIQLRGTRSSPWLPPLASSSVLTPVPTGELSQVAGLTEGRFAGARSGQVLITSIRPPCPGSTGYSKDYAQPVGPLPKVYPLRACAPDSRFGISLVVMS